MRKYICVRHGGKRGRVLGWCGTIHKYEDRAFAECRRLDRSFPDDHWDVHDAIELGYELQWLTREVTPPTKTPSDRGEAIA